MTGTRERPGGGTGAPWESLRRDTARVATTTAAALPVARVIDAGPCHPDALIVRVSCPFCAGYHRHAVEPGARSGLGRLDREAICGGGWYVLDLAGVIPHA